ncbi:AP-5 complex subunit sigma-1 [Gadus chalcogrammus]|uniref:AP-5 complex subunit sigma-1 n=1 Tax=Gadus chalcogrammus TaxID=1042646 RepID=UPI0024C2CE14|nr:AP-5 complex subunit sigma-1 [Gadus chalcogrammus]
MVHCFLINTVCPVSALEAGDSRVLFSRVFGPDDASQDEALSAEERRALQRDKLLLVARQVLSSVTLSREASGRGPTEGVAAAAAATDEATALQEADSGVQRLRAGDPFPGERSVLWLAVQSLAFSLVCLPHENLLLAEGTLRSLARHCLEHLRLLGHGSEVLLKVDRIDFLLSKLLPHGQLLFLNHRFTQSLEKDIAAYMAK